MSRRSARNVAPVSYSEPKDTDTENVGITPSKSSRTAKVEVVGKADQGTTEAVKEALRKAIEDPALRAELEEEAVIEPVKKTQRKKKASEKDIKAEDDEEETEIASTTKPKKTPVKRKAGPDANADDSKPVKKARKTKEQKEEEMVPLAARTSINTLSRSIFIGAHVSASGGVDKSIGNAAHIGSNAFALFLKSQRKWTSPPLAAEARDQFRQLCTQKKYDAAKYVLPHGSYLVNLAAKDKDKADQAYGCFLDDLQRCEELGITLYNFHPGNTNGEPRSEALERIAKQLNKAHAATSSVVTVLEIMAGTGNTVGSTFEDLRDIIAQVEKKDRVGVCIDTCHSFAAGYDLRSPEAFTKTMNNFKEVVGIQYLKAVHLNDSKAPFESHRDLHANIGTGFLGLRAFHNIVNSSLFENMPIVLETPIDKKGDDGKSVEDKSVWSTEIKLLEGLIGMDAESDEFKADEKRLWEAGASEREKFQAQANKKVARGQKTLDNMFKKAAKGKGGNKKKKTTEESGDESDGSEGGCSH